MTETDTTDVQPGGMKTAKKKKKFDYDGFWKNFIKRFFYPLLKRALPELYEAADREVEPEFLDKEFTDVLNTADPKIHTSPRFADYVLKVPLKNGGEEWVLLHIEVQGHGGSASLAVRMRTYGSLIFAHYQKEPVALAIITEKRPRDEPSYYSYSRFGTESIYRYNNLVLLELDDDELTSSDNPTDLVFYAAKCSLRSKKEFQKYQYLRKTIGLLGEQGWNRDDKRDLLLFIERILYIKDKKLVKEYTDYRQQLIKEGKIVFIPIGEQEAAEEIRKSTKEEIAKNFLANGVSPDIIAKSTNLPLDRIQSLMN